MPAEGTLPERVDRYEARIIREALHAYGGDARSTIEALGLPRKTFYDKLKRHGIGATTSRQIEHRHGPSLTPTSTRLSA